MLVFTVTSTLFKTLTDMIEDPTQIANILATSLPQVSSRIWMRYWLANEDMKILGGTFLCQLYGSPMLHDVRLTPLFLSIYTQ